MSLRRWRERLTSIRICWFRWSWWIMSLPHYMIQLNTYNSIHIFPTLVFTCMSPVTDAETIQQVLSITILEQGARRSAVQRHRIIQVTSAWQSDVKSPSLAFPYLSADFHCVLEGCHGISLLRRGKQAKCIQMQNVFRFYSLKCHMVKWMES